MTRRRFATSTTNLGAVVDVEAALAMLRIEDRSLAVEALFSAEQFAPRLPTLRSPSTWRFTGEPVYFHTGTLASPNYFPLAAELAADEIRFTIRYVTGAPMSCTGATSCSFSREAGYAHTVVIAP